jgi:triphosphoribosyl-dephospho-CoA synthetase
MLLAEVEDTNLLYRGGPEGLRLVQEEAKKILAGPEAEYEQRLLFLDEVCIRKNLSPGGCADLLALGLFLHHTRVLWEDPRA